MTHQNWKAFFAGAISCSLIFGIVACGSKKIPQWPGKIYVINTELATLERAQDNEVIEILGDDGEYIAMTVQDFDLFVQTYIGLCQSYPKSSQLVPWHEEESYHKQRVTGR